MYHFLLLFCLLPLTALAQLNLKAVPTFENMGGDLQSLGQQFAHNHPLALGGAGILVGLLFT